MVPKVPQSHVSPAQQRKRRYAVGGVEEVERWKKKREFRVRTVTNTEGKQTAKSLPFMHLQTQPHFPSLPRPQKGGAFCNRQEC